jgi:cell division protein FtsA
MPSGIVLTGGGSLLHGIRELAQDRLAMPVRLGCPISTQETQITGLPDVLKSPIYSTAYGLMLYASGGRNKAHGDSASATVFASVFRRMKSWIYDFL